MEIVVEPKELEWWFWTVTFIFIMTALLGWVGLLTNLVVRVKIRFH